MSERALLFNLINSRRCEVEQYKRFSASIVASDSGVMDLQSASNTALAALASGHDIGLKERAAKEVKVDSTVDADSIEDLVQFKRRLEALGNLATSLNFSNGSA